MKAKVLGAAMHWHWGNKMKSKCLSAALLAWLTGIGLFFSDTGASASTIHFSGTFSSATGAVFSVGEAFSGTIDYDPATAILLSGTNNFAAGTSDQAVWGENTNIVVLTGGTTYTFPLWFILVQDIGPEDLIQFIATDFNTNLFIFDQPARSALLPPEITPGTSSVFHIWISDASQAIGSANMDVTPIPSALPLFATGLGALGLLGWRRKRKASAAIAA